MINRRWTILVLLISILGINQAIGSSAIREDNPTVPELRVSVGSSLTEALFGRRSCLMGDVCGPILMRTDNPSCLENAYVTITTNVTTQIFLSATLSSSLTKINLASTSCTVSHNSPCNFRLHSTTEPGVETGTLTISGPGVPSLIIVVKRQNSCTM